MEARSSQNMLRTVLRIHAHAMVREGALSRLRAARGIGKKFDEWISVAVVQNDAGVRDLTSVDAEEKEYRYRCLNMVFNILFSLLGTWVGNTSRMTY